MVTTICNRCGCFTEGKHKKLYLLPSNEDYIHLCYRCYDDFQYFIQNDPKQYVNLGKFYKDLEEINDH